MRIACPNCQKTYNFPDSKLPAGKKVTFPCPACRARIKLDLRPKTPDDKISTLFQTRRKKPPAKFDPVTPYAKTQPSGMALKYGLLRAIGELPIMPQVALKAQEVLADPDSSMRELVRVIEIDPAITVKVLKLANSAYYGLSGKVSSVQHAGTLLGYEVLGEVITIAAISEIMDKTLKGYGLDSGKLWYHSLSVAFGSKFIAGKAHPELETDGFTAGLLHDIGKVMLDQHVYDRKNAFEMLVRDSQETFLRAEKKILGFDHADIASEFCRKWNIPEVQTQAIKYHHNPSRSQDNELAYILHVADVIAVGSDLGTEFDDMLYQMDNGAIDLLGLDEIKVSNIMAEVVQSVERITNKV